MTDSAIRFDDCTSTCAVSDDQLADAANELRRGLHRPGVGVHAQMRDAGVGEFSGALDDGASGLRAIKAMGGVAIVQSVDGLGPKAAKRNTYAVLVKKKPKSVHSGIKLFFDEDTRGKSELMTPTEVLALRPTPEYVMYE